MRALLILVVALVCGCTSWQQAPFRDVGKSYLSVGNAELRYHDTGWPHVDETADIPVLFLHGFGSSLETWELVTPLLCQARRCVSLDLPGFGLSSKYEQPYDGPDMVAHVLGLMDQLDLHRVDLVAHSYGCSVALAIASEHPQRVRRMVISDGFAYADQMPWFFAWSRPPVLGELLFCLFYDQQLDWRIPLSFHNREMVSHSMVQRAYESLRRPGTRAAALAIVRGLDLDAAEQRYGALPHRVLVVWGREDTVTPLRYGERLVQHLPRASITVVPFAGHFPMVEAPGMYAEQVSTFLAQRAPEGS
jgi:2-hydroxymuconate-semialdehyde hydrolase